MSTTTVDAVATTSDDDIVIATPQEENRSMVRKVFGACSSPELDEEESSTDIGLLANLSSKEDKSLQREFEMNDESCKTWMSSFSLASALNNGLNIRMRHSGNNVALPKGSSTEMHRLAAGANWMELRELILDNKNGTAHAEAGSVDRFGRTPLMIACTHGNRLPPDLARLLLVVNKESASVSCAGTTCLHVAASSGCLVEVLQILIRSFYEASTMFDKNGSCPLHLSVNTNRNNVNDLVQIVTVLINANPLALFTKNNRGETPLILAIYRRAPIEVLTLLLNHPKGGSEAASIPDSLGSYPIHFCDRTPIEIVRQLATNYPEAIGEANKLGDTPLFFAMNEKATVEVLWILLSTGKKIDQTIVIKNIKGINVLHSGWDSLLTPRLVAAEDQEDEDYRVKQNKKCMEVACSVKDLVGEVNTWFMKTELLLMAAYHGSIEVEFAKWNIAHAVAGTECPPTMLNFFLQIFPSEAKGIDAHGRTPLHVAAALPNIITAESCSYLIESYPQACLIQDRRGYTPLHYACLNNCSIKILEVLIEAAPGAILSQNHEGHSPLFISLSVGAPIQVIRLILRTKPQAVHIRDIRGVSPLELAWLLLISGKDIVAKDSQKEQRSATNNRSILSFAKSSTGLSGDARLWVAKIDILLRAAFHDQVDQPLPKGRHWRAVHAASMGSSCPPEILRFATQILPNEPSVRNEAGDYPIHIAAKALPYTTNTPPELASSESIDLLLKLYPDGAMHMNKKGSLPLHIALENCKTWDHGILSLLDAFPESLWMRDPTTKMFPFMIAAAAAHQAGDDWEVESSNSYEGLTSKGVVSELTHSVATVEDRTNQTIIAVYQCDAQEDDAMTEDGPEDNIKINKVSKDNIISKVQVVSVISPKSTGPTAQDSPRDVSVMSDDIEITDVVVKPEQTAEGSAKVCSDIPEEFKIINPAMDDCDKDADPASLDDDKGADPAIYDDDKGTDSAINDDDKGTDPAIHDDDKGADPASHDDDEGTDPASHDDKGIDPASHDDDKGTDPASRDDDKGTDPASHDDDKDTDTVVTIGDDKAIYVTNNDNKVNDTIANDNNNNTNGCIKLPKQKFPDDLFLAQDKEETPTDQQNSTEEKILKNDNVDTQLASLSTIYQLFRRAPELIRPFKGIVEGMAEKKYLWRMCRELQQQNSILNEQLLQAETEIVSRMSTQEINIREVNKRMEEVKRQEELYDRRADLIECQFGERQCYLNRLEGKILQCFQKLEL